MQKIANGLNEFHKRWRKIEQVAGITVTTDNSAPHPLTHITSAPHLNTLDQDTLPMSIPPTPTGGCGHAFSTVETLFKRRDSDSSSSAMSVSEGLEGNVVVGRTASFLKRRRQSDSSSCRNHQLSASTKDSSTSPNPKPAPGLKYQSETQHSSGQMHVPKHASVPLLRQNSYSEAMDSIGSGSLVDDVDSGQSMDRKILPSSELR